MLVSWQFLPLMEFIVKINQLLRISIHTYKCFFIIPKRTDIFFHSRKFLSVLSVTHFQCIVRKYNFTLLGNSYLPWKSDKVQGADNIYRIEGITNWNTDIFLGLVMRPIRPIQEQLSLRNRAACCMIQITDAVATFRLIFILSNCQLIADFPF